MGYVCIDCCEVTKSVDQMMDRFHRDRAELLDLFVRDPRQLTTALWKVLSLDRTCKCRLGKGDLRTGFRCPQCRNVGRLTKLTPDTVETPFLLECGRQAGSYLMLTEFPRVEPMLKRKDLPHTIVRKLLSRCQYRNCEPKLADTAPQQYLALDEFSNGALISFLLERVLEEDKLDRHIVRLQTAFICGDSGYYLSERPDLGSYGSIVLSPEVARGIVLQLLAVFTALTPFDFTLGRPGPSSLMFSRDSCSYLYRGLKVTSPYTLKLFDFTNAGITVATEPGLTRIYALSPLAEAYAQKTLHVSGLHLETLQEVTYYVLTQETAPLFLYLRYMGVPLFPHSFDLYVFLVGLMMDRNFYYLARRDELLDRIWRALWLSDEFPLIEERVITGQQQERPIETPEIVEALKYLHLRCDLVPALLRLVTG